MFHDKRIVDIDFSDVDENIHVIHLYRLVYCGCRKTAESMGEINANEIWENHQGFAMCKKWGQQGGYG